MTKVLIDFEDLGNRGFMAIAIGLAKSLRTHIPDVEITMFSDCPTEHEEIERKFGIKVRQNPWLWMGKKRGLLTITRYGIFAVSNLISNFVLRIAQKFKLLAKRIPHNEYDIVIHYTPDWYTETESSTLHVILPFLLLFIIRTVCTKPLALVPSGMGPFNNRLSGTVAAFVLNRVDLISLREEVSYGYVKSLNLSHPQIAQVSDLSFLLDPAPQEKVQEILRKEGINADRRPFVGICPNLHIAETGTGVFTQSMKRERKREEYIHLMAQVADYLVEALHATVCLIPHVYDYEEKKGCQWIYEQVTHKQAVAYLQGEYLSDELKGIISSCDMFIGSWMHSVIASTSVGVPSIAIAFSDKFYRIIGKTMGQEQYIVDIRNQEPSQLLTEIKAKVDSLWANRERVKQELKERSTIAQDQACLYGKLIEELVQSSKKASMS